MELIKLTLDACRKNSGMTLLQASKKVGINEQTLSKYEHDSSNISMNLLIALSELYKIPTDYIFLGKKYDLIRTLERERQST